MKKQTGFFLVLLIAAVAFNSCKNTADYQKTQSGLLYKIFSSSKDSAAKEGSILKFNYTVKIGSTDSVLQSTYDKAPGYARVGTVPADAYSPEEVFGKLRQGDSLVVVQFIDSLVKRTPGGNLPPFLKKGDKIVMSFKVINVFKSAEEATADRTAEADKEKVKMEKEMEADLIQGSKDMEDYLAKNKINAQKTGKGTFVEIKEAGSGLQADSGKYVSVRYTGKTLRDGKIFESTMDAKSQPYTFMLGAGEVIRGWDEGLKLFKKGGKGTLYVPGALAYGRHPRPDSPFKINEALIFEVYMENVSDTQPVQPQQQITPEMREQLQKQIQQQQQLQKQEQQKPKGN
jgi:FKBP-type peptidyl-prolyl cis-trans isomerase FkpA